MQTKNGQFMFKKLNQGMVGARSCGNHNITELVEYIVHNKKGRESQYCIDHALDKLATTHHISLNFVFLV